MTDLTHGPVTAQMIPLLTPGRSVLLCKRWGLMVLDRFDDSERRAFMIGLSDGQVRLLVPADKMTYIGERDDDGWITAPKGGWKSNPVPGVGGYVRFYDEGGGEIHSYTRWDDVVAFRPATPPASADGVEVQPVSNPYELEVVAWRYRFHPEGSWLVRDDSLLCFAQLTGEERQPLVLKSAADAQAAELRAEIERLTAIVAELQGLLTTHDICADRLARKQEERR